MSNMTADWNTLKCKCGSDQFIKITKLKWNKGGGTTEVIGGWKCSSCEARVDISDLINRAKRSQLEKEREALETEIANS